jgi:hypothetical protein
MKLLKIKLGNKGELYCAAANQWLSAGMFVLTAIRRKLDRHHSPKTK